jgi:hypothetical protein
MSKIKYVRNGVERFFSEETIEQFSTKENPFPESEGWVKAPEEVGGGNNAAADKAAADKAAADKAAAEASTASAPQQPAANAPQDGQPKVSKDFIGADIPTLEEQLAEKSREEIEAFFAGEDRKGMLALKESLIAKFQA